MSQTSKLSRQNAQRDDCETQYSSKTKITSKYNVIPKIQHVLDRYRSTIFRPFGLQLSTLQNMLPTTHFSYDHSRAPLIDLLELQKSTTPFIYRSIIWTRKQANNGASKFEITNLTTKCTYLTHKSILWIDIDPRPWIGTNM